MTTWFNASHGVVEAANSAMQEIAKGFQNTPEDHERMRAAWEPTANALIECIPDDFTADAGHESEIVGVTSDTQRVVTWGPEIPLRGCAASYRLFVID